MNDRLVYRIGEAAAIHAGKMCYGRLACLLERVINLRRLIAYPPQSLTWRLRYLLIRDIALCIIANIDTSSREKTRRL